MKCSFFLSMLFLFATHTGMIAAESQQFLNHQKGLRIDFILAGDHSTQQASVTQLYQVPVYSSGPEQDLPPLNYGNYRLLALSPHLQDTLFMKGFCTLFQEWQSTAEAQNHRRAFRQTIEMPLPRKKIEWMIQFRQEGGQFATLLQEVFDPEQTSYHKKSPVHHPWKYLHRNDTTRGQTDILIMSEGYTPEEKDRFFEDAQNMIDYLFSMAPYDSLKNHITVRAQAIPSKDSGITDPNREIWKNTPFKSSFNTFGTDRYLESLYTWTVYDQAVALPHDHIVILVNTDKYGGGGVYNHFSITSARNRASAKVFVHELGHGLAGLGDEYFSSAVAYGGFFDLNTEPWHPNITTLKDFSNKWKHLVADTVPIPTPVQPEYQNVTGVFEGAGYSSRDIFRPAINCRMRTNEAEGFCEVCRMAIQKMILFYSNP